MIFIFYIMLDLPACTSDFWQLYPNTEVTGGTQVSTGADRNTCLSSCESTATCVAFNYVGTTCYFFYVGVAAVTTAGNNANSVHFRRCNAPLSPSPSTSMYGCIIWMYYMGMLYRCYSWVYCMCQ